jgi:fido (protein-threonine AMPylation protein)
VPHAQHIALPGHARGDSGKWRKIWEGQIHNAMTMAFDNIRYWVEHTSFSQDEIAVRLHHSLVAIPSPNGNGRHTI